VFVVVVEGDETVLTGGVDTGLETGVVVVVTGFVTGEGLVTGVCLTGGGGGLLLELVLEILPGPR